MKVILGFLSASLVASFIYTFWAVGGQLDVYKRVFPVVLLVAFFQCFLLAGPAYFWLKAKNKLQLLPIVIVAVLCAVLPWMVLHLISALDHQYLKHGDLILIENGHLTLHWWKRFLINLTKLAFCGAVAAIVFNLIIANRKSNS